MERVKPKHCPKEGTRRGEGRGEFLKLVQGLEGRMRPPFIESSFSFSSLFSLKIKNPGILS